MTGNRVVVAPSPPHQVAFDLMVKISMNEDAAKKLQPDARTYYLKLYSQCHNAVINGWDSESALRGN